MNKLMIEEAAKTAFDCMEAGECIPGGMGWALRFAYAYEEARNKHSEGKPFDFTNSSSAIVWVDGVEVRQGESVKFEPKEGGGWKSTKHSEGFVNKMIEPDFSIRQRPTKTSEG